ncbi:hypothetical protein ASG20_08795 [Sphingomonas sp. Leaf198]|nr:hypothetical protein ASG20_08795 [Sphingomonas sp. Leaf198]
MSPDWAPAFAGVVLGLGWRKNECYSTRLPRSLFSREGGSPDWVPAFAGKHAIDVRERRF